MALRDIKPTRSELINLKRKIQLSERGYKILKMKRDGLILEFFKILANAKDTKGELLARHKRAVEMMALANTVEGAIGVKSAAFSVKEVPEITLKSKGDLGDFFHRECRRFYTNGAFYGVGKRHHLDCTLVPRQEFSLGVLCIGKDLEKFQDQSIALHLEDFVATLGELDLPHQVDQLLPGRLYVSQRHVLLLLLCTCFNLRVVLVDQLTVNSGKLFNRQRREQVPAKVQGIFYGAILVIILADKAVLKDICELEEEAISLGECVLADDSHKAAEIVTFRVPGIHLVRDLLVVFPRVSLSYTEIHQPRKRGQYIDGRVDTLTVKIPVDHDLAFGDIPGQVRDRMGDIITGHRQDRNLGD